MSTRVARWLNMGGHGLHSDDPLARTPLPALAVALDEPAATEAEALVVITDEALETLAGIKAQVERAARPAVPVAADLALSGGYGGCPVLRDLVRGYFVRAEPHHGQLGEDGKPLLDSDEHPVICGFQAGGEWPERFAAIWQHRTGAVPEPDYDLGRYEGMASDAIASGLAKADAEWAARKTEDAPERPEHEGRHAGRRAAWTGSEAAS